MAANPDFQEVYKKRGTTRQTKKVVQTTTSVVVDSSTGEVLTGHTHKTLSKEVEPPYVKLYLEDIGRLHGLPPFAVSALHQLVRSMGYSNIVPMYKPIKELMCNQMGIKMNTLNKAVQVLSDAGILIRVNNGRGLYMVDPNLFARGSWENIKTLRLQIEYDNKGNRHITSNISDQNIKQLDIFQNAGGVAENPGGSAAGGEAPQS